MKLFKQKPGVVSPGSCWVCSYKGCYLHINESLLKLLWEVITEYKSDKHLVG